MMASTAFGEGVLLGGVVSGLVIALVARREVVRLRSQIRWLRRWSTAPAYRDRHVPEHVGQRRTGNLRATR